MLPGAETEIGYVTRKDPAIYLQWMRIFEAITNPVVFVTDRVSVAHWMLELRKQRPTVVNIDMTYCIYSTSVVVSHVSQCTATYSFCHKYHTCWGKIGSLWFGGEYSNCRGMLLNTEHHNILGLKTQHQKCPGVGYEIISTPESNFCKLDLQLANNCGTPLQLWM